MTDGNYRRDGLGAKAFGLDYIAITDHTKSLKLAGGLEEQELLEQADKISQLNDRLREEEFRILSAEVNIMKDGSLDIPNTVLDKLDIVGAAIHAHFNLPIETQTEAADKSCQKPKRRHTVSSYWQAHKQACLLPCRH